MGGGAMVKPVAGGIGGGATNHHHHQSSLPPLHLPVSANSTLPFLPNRTSRPLFLGESSTRTVQPTDGREDDDRAVGSYYDSVFRLVPFMLGLRTTEFEWLQKMLYLHNPSMLKSLGFGSVDDAFRLLQTDPSVQRMVSSISSDKAVWDAILSNKAVQNLQHSLVSAAKEEKPQAQSSSEKTDLATMIVDWILDIAKAKVLELIEQFISLLTMIFQPPDHNKNLGAANTDGRLDEKLRSSLLLSIVILLIVVVTRAHGV
ncbi:hypothetical protein RHSIM_Rhsim01G0136600 [Rhododendron simsii]|uniref:Uncharacterized protein n=1 Tax=Rhododendron simsii TaxID=118357 RepID=A0A834HEN9_RHOSS|nr:hypothetical protein RHSIM_RhsimUnG0213800 [Rhododendron simsii]KAF7152617.1 hypothetical protein RHSIM_Rhsim01G0136600 [Rhododendron simsii]